MGDHPEDSDAAHGAQRSGAEPPPPPRLAREIGGRALAATLFNAVLGAGIFLLPAAAAAELGPAAPLAYLLAAAVVGLVALVFAEAGSRVPSSGGPYAFVEAGLGRYAGFLAGLLLWSIGTFATAAVANGFIAHLPGLGAAGRAAGLTALFAALAAVNVRGVRRGALLVEAATLVKLVPLVPFVAVGAFFVSPERLVPGSMPPAARVAATTGLLIFAFGGMESGLAPIGEVRNPARTIPRALFGAMGAVAVFYVAVQLVAQGILGADLARASAAPLAAAAGRALGPIRGCCTRSRPTGSRRGCCAGSTRGIERRTSRSRSRPRSRSACP
jgi:amino acid transporter